MTEYNICFADAPIRSNSEKQVAGVLGEAVTLKCTMCANPRSQSVIWYFKHQTDTSTAAYNISNKPINTHSRGIQVTSDDNITISGSTLRITRMQETQYGDYTCIVSNIMVEIDQAEKSFTITLVKSGKNIYFNQSNILFSIFNSSLQQL